MILLRTAMADFSAVSRSTVAARRRRLRRHRRIRALQAFWRLLVVMGLAGGAIWLIKSPIWVIQSPEQITIEGNELLSPERVRSLLPMHYPKPLWAVQPEAIAKELEAGGPIAQAVVTRHLWPPGVTIQIQERRPVAIAQDYSPDPTDPVLAMENTNAGLLDATGAWIPLEDYTLLNPAVQMPALTVVGMRAGDREQWVAIYAELNRFQATANAPVRITELDWRDPGNLILSTELGHVHLGVYQSPSLFTQQLQALNQMRQLSKNTEFRPIEYIDLRRPESPLLQLR